MATKSLKPKKPNPRREARERAGVTPEEVAKRAGICVAYYKQIERGQQVSFGLARSLSFILGCHIDVYL